MLLENIVLGQQLSVLLFEFVSFFSNLFEIFNKLFDLLLQSLLVVLLSLSASYGRLSILKSLPGLLVFDGILQECVCAIFVNYVILEILLFLIG